MPIEVMLSRERLVVALPAGEPTSAVMDVFDVLIAVPLPREVWEYIVNGALEG